MTGGRVRGLMRRRFKGPGEDVAEEHLTIPADATERVETISFHLSFPAKIVPKVDKGTGGSGAPNLQTCGKQTDLSERVSGV